MPPTRFEKARIVGARALQIASGAPPLSADARTTDPVQVALEEFAGEGAPMTVLGPRRRRARSALAASAPGRRSA